MVFENLKVFLSLKQYFLSREKFLDDDNNVLSYKVDNKLNIEFIKKLWKEDIDVFPFIKDSL